MVCGLRVSVYIGETELLEQDSKLLTLTVLSVVVLSPPVSLLSTFFAASIFASLGLSRSVGICIICVIVK